MEKNLKKEVSDNNSFGVRSDVDEVLEATGSSCGRFQMYFQLFFMILVLAIGYHGILAHFASIEPPWKCNLHDQSNFCRKHMDRIFYEENKEFPERCKLNRSEWTYTPKTNYSYITEFHLDCDKSLFAAFTSSAFYTGGIIGAILSGFCADFYGRKRVLVISLFFIIVSSIECSFIGNIWQLNLLRGLLGASQTSALIIAFVTLLEFMAPSHRSLSTGFFLAAFSVSQMILDALAYSQMNWRRLQYYASFPAILPLIVILFISETPRWLLAVKRKSDATRVLKRIAKFNGNDENKITLKYLDTYHHRRYFTPVLFRNLDVFRVTLIQCLLWMAVAMLQYYVIDFVSVNLHGNLYKAFAISSLANIPGSLAAIDACTRLGRKKTVLVSLIIAGSAIALIEVIRSSSATINISLGFLIKFLVHMACTAIWLWSFELFPTVVRAKGMSLCISFERIGACLAPFIVKALRHGYSGSEHIMMCVVAISSVLIVLFQSETNDLTTRETYEDFFEKPVGYQTIPP